MQFQLLLVLSSVAAAVIASPISSVEAHGSMVDVPTYRIRATETKAHVAPKATGALL